MLRGAALRASSALWQPAQRSVLSRVLQETSWLAGCGNRAQAAAQIAPPALTVQHIHCLVRPPAFLDPVEPWLNMAKI